MSKPLENVKGWTVGQLAAVLHAIGGPKAGKKLLKDKKLGVAVSKFITDAPSMYTQTIRSLLNASKVKFDQKNINDDFSLEPIEVDEDEWEVHEHYFDHEVKGATAYSSLKRLGYRYCGLRRALEYIAKGNFSRNLNNGRDFALVVTKRFKNEFFDNWYVPIIKSYDYSRELTFGSLDGNYKIGCRWLVLRRRS